MRESQSGNAADMRTCLLLSFLLLIATGSSAQENEMSERSVFPFVSIGFGSYGIRLDNFDEVYGNAQIPDAGARMGIPLAKRLHVVGELHYAWKRGTSIVYTYDADFNIISSEPGGEARFSMWLFNLGGQYHFKVGQKWVIAVEGGLSFINGSENQTFADGSPLSDAHIKGFLGCFAGAQLERKIKQLGLFINPKIVFSQSDIADLNGDYGGANISAGIKCYF